MPTDRPTPEARKIERLVRMLGETGHKPTRTHDP